MRRILFILPSLPYPLLTGADQAMYNGLKAINNDCEVFVTFPVPMQKRKAVEKRIANSKLDNIQLKPFFYNPFKNFFDFVIRRITIFQGKIKKKNFDYFCSQMSTDFSIQLPDYIQFINDCVKKNDIEIVQIEQCQCLSYVLALPANIKKVFVHHELRFVVNEQKIHEFGENAYRKAWAEEAKILELEMLNRFDAVITLSKPDMETLQKSGVSVPIYPSKAIVAIKSYSGNSNASGNVLSFVGPSQHIPNFVGVKWFLKNCWEKLLQQDASYRLKIIGNWSDDCRQEITQKFKNVEFKGFVSNLADALNDTIMIVPITIGSGIRMKILEAASLGIPFVSTTIGAEGLPFESGRDCLKGDTPEAFVDAVLKMRDKSLRVEFAKKADALVRENYSIDALRKNRLEIYEKVMTSEKS